MTLKISRRYCGYTVRSISETVRDRSIYKVAINH